LGLGISSFFWLPAFTEKSYAWVNYLQTSKSIFIKEFINTEWKNITIPTYIPMMMNWVYLTLPILSIILILVLHKLPLRTTPARTKKIVLISSLFSIIGIFFATEFSIKVWGSFYDYLYIFQFPWRFWIVVTFFSSFLAGWILVVSSGKSKIRLIILAGIMIIGIMWYSYPNFRPVRYEFVDKYRAEDPCGTSWGFEYLQLWTTSCLKREPYPLEEIVGGNAELSSIKRGRQSYSFTVEGDDNRVRIEKYYYPGWEATIDGKKAVIEYDNPYGLIEIAIPKGKHAVSLNFKDTPLRLFSNTLSVIAIVVSLFLLALGLKKKYHFSLNRKVFLGSEL
jgi:hypothetical protein